MVNNESEQHHDTDAELLCYVRSNELGGFATRPCLRVGLEPTHNLLIRIHCDNINGFAR